MSVFDDFFVFQCQIEVLFLVVECLGWDQEIVMLCGVVEQCSEEMVVMEVVLYECCIDLCIGEWLDQVQFEDVEDQCIFDLIVCDYCCVLCIFVWLVMELVWQILLLQGVWVEVCVKDVFDDFLLVLNDIVMLKCEEVVVLVDGGDFYDVLLDDYEYGMMQVEIVMLFDVMCFWLVVLCEDVLGVEYQLQVFSGDFL